ncbi:hypothetical protein JOL79_06265 [Microbispora sp. RL4-1S]|uniref:Serine protease n=1 Tax=Microbispora oryzae TaxID=2806554 RepID=A0A940WEY0_9ACTN|nr:hypothetical protein [Microbispora oryzae]MBP2703403.1 hypothetical protein [Microbispora oryzae]
MKRTLAFGGLVATAGLLAAGLAAPAQAAGDVSSDPLAKSGVAALQVVKYWRGENYSNFVNATPYNAETAVAAKHMSKGGPAPDSKPGIVPAIGDEKKSTSKSKNVNLPKTTGKVFFRGSDNKPHWCSATSVQSAYHNMVATAGHCVYDTESNKATLDYWVFVPGYYQGKTPWGIYVGKTAYTHYDYDVYEDGDRDYAFVTVYNGVQVTGWDRVKRQLILKDTGRLGDNVGGQGIAYNQKIGQPVFVFGYPSGTHPDGNQAFTGKTLKWTYGKTFAAKAPAIKGEELQAVKSSFTGEGALGSSWLLKYNNTRRLGYLNGVTIGVSDTDGNNRYDTSISPYFDGELYGVYSAAKNNWSGSLV